MSCAPTPCPPALPTPVSRSTWTEATNYICGGIVGYYNTAVTVVNSCPVGDPQGPVSATVAANTFFSTISQEAADDQALALATAQADALRALSPCGGGGDDDFLLTEGSDYLLLEDGSFILL